MLTGIVNGRIEISAPTWSAINRRTCAVRCGVWNAKASGMSSFCRASKKPAPRSSSASRCGTTASRSMGRSIIGDVHGCYDELVALLAKLGYGVDAENCRAIPPAGRKTIFVGDLVDRGPKIPFVLKLAMSMTGAGHALCVPGNHDMKLLRKLRGRDVQITHGLPVSVVYSHRPGLFRSIVHTLVLAGNADAARTVLAQISAMAVQESDPEKKKGILGPLAAAQADVGDIAAALYTMEPIKSDFFAQTFMMAIADEQARQGDVAGALATLAGIPHGLSMIALQEMSRTLSDSGNYSGARAAVDKMSSPGERAYGLASLAFEQCDNDPAGARLNVALAWTLAQQNRTQAPSYVFQNAVRFVAATQAWRLHGSTGNHKWPRPPRQGVAPRRPCSSDGWSG